MLEELKFLLITNKSKDEVNYIKMFLISENIWEKIEVESTNEDLDFFTFSFDHSFTKISLLFSTKKRL